MPAKELSYKRIMRGLNIEQKNHDEQQQLEQDAYKEEQAKSQEQARQEAIQDLHIQMLNNLGVQDENGNVTSLAQVWHNMHEDNTNNFDMFNTIQTLTEAREQEFLDKLERFDSDLNYESLSQDSLLNYQNNFQEQTQIKHDSGISELSVDIANATLLGVLNVRMTGAVRPIIWQRHGNDNVVADVNQYNNPQEGGGQRIDQASSTTMPFADPLGTLAIKAQRYLRLVGSLESSPFLEEIHQYNQNNVPGYNAQNAPHSDPKAAPKPYPKKQPF